MHDCSALCGSPLSIYDVAEERVHLVPLRQTRRAVSSVIILELVFVRKDLLLALHR